MREETTLVLVKPDAIVRGLTGAVLSRLAEAKLTLAGAKAMRVSRELAEEHYEALKDKPFYEELLRYLCGELHGVTHVLALVYMGSGAVGRVRQLAGATNPEQADPSTIRGALGRITTKGVMENVLHASSDPQEAEREIKLWFRPDELLVQLYPITEATSMTHTTAVWG
jgi:nucleoside-diphosphate kinase